MTEPKTSPLPVTVTHATTNFYEALKIIFRGAKMRRLAWEDKNVYIFMRNGRLSIMTDEVHDLIVTEGDMLAEDWVLYKEDASPVQ